MEGFDKLLLKDGTLSEDARAVLSRTDNLRMMEKRFNLARRDTRWEDWGTGRRLYGKEVFDRMPALETKLRAEIQWDILARAARR